MNTHSASVQLYDFSGKNRHLKYLVVFFIAWLMLWLSDRTDRNVQDYLISSLQALDKSPPQWIWMLGIILLLKDVFSIGLVIQAFLWIQFPRISPKQFTYRVLDSFHLTLETIGRALWKLPLLILPGLIQFLQITYLPVFVWYQDESLSPRLALRNTAMRVVVLISFVSALAIAFEALFSHYSDSLSEAMSPGFRALLLGVCTCTLHRWYLQFGRKLKATENDNKEESK